jgi:hypothetical protein
LDLFIEGYIGNPATYSLAHFVFWPSQGEQKKSTAMLFSFAIDSKQGGKWKQTISL